MSEYQYYEFVAIDRPLTPKEIEQVGEYSTRAEITPTSFVNEYHWGNFRGDVHDFLTRFFDAHLYHANWGWRTFAFRVPSDAIDLKSIDPYCTQEVLTVSEKRGCVIVDFSTHSDGNGDDGSGGGYMASLVSNRSELMAGDLRSLYLGWLRAAQQGDVDAEEAEPPVPDGLTQLSAAQIALAEFLRLDSDLLDVASRASRQLRRMIRPRNSPPGPKPCRKMKKMSC